MCGAFWLWYPGDFELYHALRQNFSRVERGYGRPAISSVCGRRRRTAALCWSRAWTIFKTLTAHCPSAAETDMYILAGTAPYWRPAPTAREAFCGWGKTSIGLPPIRCASRLF